MLAVVAVVMSVIVAILPRGLMVNISPRPRAHSFYVQLTRRLAHPTIGSMKNRQTTRGWSIERKIAFHSKPANDGTGCILWTARPGGGGYPHLSVNNKTKLVCRIVLEKKLGRPIADGMESCHSCHRKLCVFEDHLSEGTHQSNIEDRQKAKRHAHGERVSGAKLKAEQIPAIRSDPRSERALAEVYGVSANVIGEIKRGNSWKHVP